MCWEETGTLQDGPIDLVSRALPAAHPPCAWLGELQSAMPRLRQRAPAALPAVLENILRACVLPPVGACTATDWAASLAWCSRVSAAGKLVRPRGELAHILSLPPLYLGKIANLVLVCTVRAWALLAQLDVQTSHLISVFLPFLCD
jgi:hypothetical protein